MSKCRMIFLFDFCMILSEAHKDLEEVTLWSLGFLSPINYESATLRDVERPLS